MFFLLFGSGAAEDFAGGEPSTNSQAELRLQQGHSREVRTCKWSPDGRTLATASLDGTVRLWEGQTGKLIRTIVVDDDEIWLLAWSPDGTRLTSAKHDGTVGVWEAASGKLLHLFPSEGGRIHGLDWSSDGRFVAWINADRTARIWEPAGVGLSHSLEGHTSSVLSISWSPDGRSVATSSLDGAVRLWEAEDRKLKRTLSGHTAEVGKTAWSPDGTILASVSTDETVRLWSVDTGAQLHTLRGHDGVVSSVAWSPDGKTLVTGSLDQTAILWDVPSGAALRVLPGHQGWLVSVSWSPDARVIATLGRGGCARFWEAQTGKPLWLISESTDQVRSVSWASSGGPLATASDDGTAKIWDPWTGELLHTLSGEVSGLKAALWSPDGKSLALAGFDGDINIWNLAEGRPSSTFSGHQDWIEALAWSPDGQTLASASEDQSVRLWSPAGGKALRTLSGHSGIVRSVAWSPDGLRLASSSFDGEVRIWEGESGRLEHVLTGHTAEVGSVVWSPDGRRLASTGSDGSIRTWDPQTGESLGVLTERAESPWSLAWSPDGKSLATGGNDGQVAIWDASNGELIRAFPERALAATSVSWSPDGRHLAAAVTNSRAVMVWNVQTGVLEHTLLGHLDSVLFVAWSPDGKVLLSAGEDGTARIWDPVAGRELATLANFSDGGWAVVTPEGYFDASESGRRQLHLALALEALDLEQLKDRYWVPGLLIKVLKNESLPDAPALSASQLYPGVATRIISSKSGDVLEVDLTDRGGGIGPVRVLVNGIEVEGDARGGNVDPTARELKLRLDLQGVPLKAGQENQIEVIAWNQEGFLRSRAVRTLFQAPESPNPVSPRLFALVVGVSSYTARSLDLVYSGKDAWDMATALLLGGGELFGEERVDVTLLSSVRASGELPKGLSYDEPSRVNIEKALEHIRTQARAEDVLLVYFAGHGLTLGGRDGLYCFLTQEANTATPEAYLDPAVRQTAALSSDDLVEHLKAIPALKRILILDTCAAGSASERLVALRDLSGDQLLALDRMRDRTGLHVLMGSAADRVSYEATRYRQGLLTYSLLKGMKGAALREGGLVDVSRLLQYARDEVPRLAQDIGGSQNPEILTPAQAESFDIGLMSEETQGKIRLATPVPMVLSPIFQDPETLDDQLKLGSLVAAEMRQLSAGLTRGEESLPAVAYVDSADMAGAIRPRGGYRVENNRVELKLVLILGEQRLGPFEVSGTLDDLPGLAQIIARRIAQEGAKL